MSIKTKKIIAVVCTFFLAAAVYIEAQNTVVSPYSRLGLGELQHSNMPHIRAKGGLGATDWSYRNLNITNPASYAYLRSASMNAGFNIQYNKLSDQDTDVDIWGGGMNSLVVGFPLINTINEMLEETYSDWRYGTVIGLQPYSTIGYEIESTGVDPELGEIRRSFEGSGGSQMLFAGQAIRYKNTSIGFNAGYLFGSLEQNRRMGFPNVSVHYANEFEDEIKMRSFYWKAGFLHNFILNRNEDNPYHDNRGKPIDYITIGAHGKAATNFTNNSNSLHLGRHIFANELVDTLFQADNLRSSGQLPPEFGFGASYVRHERFEIGFDIEAGLWSQYKNEAKREELKNSFRLGVGGSFTPDHQSITSFFQRVTYRGGLYYYRDPRVASGSQLTEYGLNFGASFPFIVQRQVSSLHTNFQIGRRGVDTALEEFFINLSFGFTVNDNTWFIKRRYD